MKSKGNNYFFIMILLLYTPIITFPQECLWSSQAGGTSYDGGGLVATDQSGNTYITGITKSSPCYFNTDTIQPGLFIVKYDNSGIEQWVRHFNVGSGSNQGEEGNITFTIDIKNEKLLIAGTFYNYLGLPDTTLQGIQNTVFILKMDFNGNIIWYKTAGGSGDDQAFGITHDDIDNIYICGSNEKDATFNKTTIPRGGYIAMYDGQGNFVWAKNKFRYFNPYVAGTWYPFTEAAPTYVLYSDNALLINGAVVNDTIVIDTITIINNPGFISSYIASFNMQGDIKWIKLAGGPQGACGSHIATDNSNNIFITGMFTKTGLFGNDTLTQPGDYGDCFIAKYNVNGGLIWATNTRCSMWAWGWGLASSSDGSVYLSGNFHGTAYFGNTMLTSVSKTDDMFLAKYASDGSNIGVRQYGEGGIYSIALDESSNVCFTGAFKDTLTIGSNTFISHGQYDLFAAKCSPILSGIESPESQSNQLLIYANPTSGICNITIPMDFQNEKELTLFVYDMTGKLVRKVPVKIKDEKLTFDIQAQAKGVYQAVLTNYWKRYTGKIIFE
ncbi:T9SS C-terminal target domain-containing protein [bacterium]|nr:MAG: T9SS C-terminal target domain-containing protein [bacterium]